jgi:4-aminobutyrate--pyruvate transaminase
MNRLSNSPEARDIAYHVHGYTNLRTHLQQGPLVIVRGKGVRVYDNTGRDYIEALAGLWCTALGFGEERLIQAATREMRKLSYYHGFAGLSTDSMIDLAERLIKIAPAPMSKVLFANSGSEANDLAVKLVWYYNNARGRPKKKKIVSRIKGYHGVTVATASLTGLPHLHNDFDLPIDRILHTTCPHHYRFAEPGESEEEFASRCAADLDKLIREQGADTVAAFIAEPVMGAGGVIVPPATYFEKIQAVLKRHDVLLIADEVICGFGRTGNMFGCQTFGIAPDMLSVAKALSSAYVPISALLVSDAVFQAMVSESEKLGVFGHGSTYGGHPVGAATALEALRIYEERDIVAHVRKVAPRLQDGLLRFADHPLVGEVRGVGLVGAVEMVRDKKTKESFLPKDGVGAHMMGRLREHGVITRVINDATAFSPPLVITAPEIDDLLERFGRALDDTWAWARQRGLC